MAEKTQPKDSPPAASGNPATGNRSTVNVEEAVRPFQEAANKFLQSTQAAQESAIRQRTQAWLDSQQEARDVEHEANRALSDATRKYVDQFGQQGANITPEQVYASRLQAQADFEKEVRRVQADAEARMTAIAKKSSDENGPPESVQKLGNQLQQAYQTYMSDLQQAWAGTTSLDPQTINAIATHILCTINSVSQTG